MFLVSGALNGFLRVFGSGVVARGENFLQPCVCLEEAGVCYESVISYMDEKG